MIQLKDLQPGQWAKLMRYHPMPNKDYQRRLIAMGLVPGTLLQLVRMAPFGDPIEVLVRGYSLSLRKREAAILALMAINS